MYGYIYRITDLSNGKCYIGQHKYNKPMLDPKYHGSSSILKNQIKAHPERFLEELLMICATLKEANYFETYFIDHMNTLSPNGYNLNRGGDKWEQTDRTKEKRSERFKGENNPNYGKTFSEETRRKISEAHKGREPWNKGKHNVQPKRIDYHPSEETLKKMKENMLNIWKDENYRKRQSEAHKGKKPGNYIHIPYELLYDLRFVKKLSYNKIGKILGLCTSAVHNKCKMIENKIEE